MCHKYFCIKHIRGVIHDCDIYHNEFSGMKTNVGLKSKLNSKINELQNDRNKKPKNKKKK